MISYMREIKWNHWPTDRLGKRLRELCGDEPQLQFARRLGISKPVAELYRDGGAERLFEDLGDALPAVAI